MELRLEGANSCFLTLLDEMNTHPQFFEGFCLIVLNSNSFHG